MYGRLEEEDWEIVGRGRGGGGENVTPTCKYENLIKIPFACPDFVCITRYHHNKIQIAFWLRKGVCKAYIEVIVACHSQKEILGVERVLYSMRLLVLLIKLLLEISIFLVEKSKCCKVLLPQTGFRWKSCRSHKK